MYYVIFICLFGVVENPAVNLKEVSKFYNVNSDELAKNRKRMRYYHNYQNCVPCVPCTPAPAVAPKPKPVAPIIGLDSHGNVVRAKTSDPKPLVVPSASLEEKPVVVPKRIPNLEQKLEQKPLYSPIEKSTIQTPLLTKPSLIKSQELQRTKNFPRY